MNQKNMMLWHQNVPPWHLAMPAFPHNEMMQYFPRDRPHQYYEVQYIFPETGQQEVFQPVGAQQMFEQTGQQQVFPPTGAQHMFLQTGQQHFFPQTGAQQVFQYSGVQQPFPHSGQPQVFLPNGMQQMYPPPDMQHMYQQPGMHHMYSPPGMQQMYQQSGMPYQGAQQIGIHQGMQLNGIQRHQQTVPVTSADDASVVDKDFERTIANIREQERLARLQEEERAAEQAKNSNPCWSMQAVSQEQGTVQRRAVTHEVFHQLPFQQSVEHGSRPHVEQPPPHMPQPIAFPSSASSAQLSESELGSAPQVLAALDPDEEKRHETETYLFLVNRFRETYQGMLMDDLPNAQDMPHVHQMPPENFNHEICPGGNHIVQMTPNINPTTPTVAAVETNDPHQAAQIPIPQVQACVNTPVFDYYQAPAEFHGISERSNAPTVANAERMGIIQHAAPQVQIDQHGQSEDATTETTNECPRKLAGGSLHNSGENSIPKPISLSHAFINILRDIDNESSRIPGSGVCVTHDLRTSMHTTVEHLKAERPGKSIQVNDALFHLLRSLSRREPNNSSALSFARGALSAIDAALISAQTENRTPTEGPSEDVPMEVDVLEEDATHIASDANEERQLQSSSRPHHGSSGRPYRVWPTTDVSPESLTSTSETLPQSLPTPKKKKESIRERLARVFGSLAASDCTPKILKTVLSGYVKETIDASEAEQRISEVLEGRRYLRWKYVQCVKEEEENRRARRSSKQRKLQQKA